LNAQLDLEAVLQTVCEATAQALKTPAAAVYFYDASQDVFEYTAGFLSASYKTQVFPVPRDIYERIFLGGKTPSVENIQLFPEAYDLIPIMALDMRSIAAVNLMRGDQIIGSLAVYTFGEERIFSADDIMLLRGLADQAALAIANARLYQESQQRLLNMQALHRIDTTINSTLDLRLVLRTILEQMTSHLHVDAADVLLTNYQMNYLEFAVGYGFRTDHIEKTRIRFGYDLPGYVALERRPIYIQRQLEKQLEIQRFNLLAPEGFQGYYGIPLIAKGKVQGVIEIFHRSPLEVAEEWFDFVATLAGQAALAIDNTNLFTSLQRSNMELTLAYDVTLEGWSRAMDLRDRETEGHTQRVAEMTVQLAKALGLSDVEIINARRGALLHDMGKLGIPDEILHKPGKLTEEEWDIMKKHPTYAYEMLSPIAFLRPALEIPYCHHEKWDGTGYPRGLKGRDIPIAARIFSVADVWDALRSDRPYRKAWTDDKVLKYIEEHTGDYFDPKVVEAFLQLPETVRINEGV
jgi:HD-GYP domain-containing protein (c-di-GMP phosphodiesterase class II)